MADEMNGVPEALRLAALLDADVWPGSMSLVGYARACVAELLRLHAELEAQPVNTKTHDLLSTMIGLFLRAKEKTGYQPGSAIDNTVAEAVEHLKDWPHPEPTPSPQAAQQAPAERSVQRMDGWTDARYIAELENVARLLRRDREKLHRVREALSDCSGGQPCSTCPDKKACQRGCVRQEEFISTEYHAQQRSRAAQQVPAGATPEGWVTWWPSPSRKGHEPIYSHGPKQPGYGAELDAVLRKYPVFAAPAAPSTPASPTIEGENNG